MRMRHSAEISQIEAFLNLSTAAANWHSLPRRLVLSFKTEKLFSVRALAFALLTTQDFEITVVCNYCKTSERS
jgi:hypothetical protein